MPLEEAEQRAIEVIRVAHDGVVVAVRYADELIACGGVFRVNGTERSLSRTICCSAGGSAENPPSGSRATNSHGTCREGHFAQSDDRCGDVVAGVP